MNNFPPLPEHHQTGQIIFDQLPQLKGVNYLKEADLGIQIASNGRVWICINGLSFLRFKPQKHHLSFYWQEGYEDFLTFCHRSLSLYTPSQKQAYHAGRSLAQLHQEQKRTSSDA